MQSRNPDGTINQIHTIILKRITPYINSVFIKLRSHRANGQGTYKKSVHLFVSSRIRFMSVSNPMNQFLIRRCPLMFIPSGGKF